MLEEATRRIAAIRFAGDVSANASELGAAPDARAHSRLAAAGVGITSRLLPDVYESLASTCRRLQLPLGSVNAYVVASPEVQASCCLTSRERCMLSISSAAVDLLRPEELPFILGHELGHFLYRHEGLDANPSSIESAMLQRAKEVSADRVGLLACQSLEAATRAIMKAAAGLDERHLRFDVSSFLAQLEHVEERGQDAFATHPSLLVRCRALMWFSLSAECQGSAAGKDLTSIDDRVERDLERFVDSSARETISEAHQAVFLWLLVLAATRDGRLSREDQGAINAAFGNVTVEKVVRMLSGLSREAVLALVSEKMVEAIGEFRRIAPRAAGREVPVLVRQVASQLGTEDFPEHIGKVLAGASV